MKKICFFLATLLLCLNTFAQKESILDYDPCSEEQEQTTIKQYLKAFSYFQDRKYQKASSFLMQIIKEESNFASPYFLMGLIGVNTGNDKMIEKYFPLCVQNCEEFSHPLLWYYLGIVDYSNEDFEKAQKDFQKFMNLSDGMELYGSLQDEAINYLNWSDFLQETMSKPVDFRPTRIEYLAPRANYYEPFISYDENELYFLREEIIRDSVRDSFLSSQETKKEILTGKAKKNDKGFFDRGFVEDLPFNTGKREGRVCITPDNNLLLFSVKNTEKENSSWDIFYCEKYDGYWTESKRLNISTNSYDELQPSISSDGNILYFVSDRPGGKGKYDIWYSKRESKNIWSDPINMGGFINTPYDEMMPYISADNQMIYFISNGWRSIGGFDIFYSNINSQSKPNNIGYPINTEESERGIGVLADGKTAYTTLLDKDKTFYEINKFILPEKARAKERALLNGTTQLEISTDITLNVLNIQDETISNNFVSSTNNNFTLMLSPNEEYLLFFNKLGYMFYSKIIKTSMQEDLIVEVKPLESGQRMKLNDIFLNKQGTDFSHESSIVLNSFVSFLQFNPHTRIVISANNDLLEMIYDYIIRSGIREDRISKQEISGNEIFYGIN